MLKAAEVVKRGPVGWVVIRDVQELMEQGWEADEYAEIHTAIAMGLEELRFDPEIRIVGLTGERNGDWYNVPLRRRYDEEQRHRDRHNVLKRNEIKGLNDNGPQRRYPSAVETLVLMEKPVIARVNGNAIGFGQSLLWGCDIIVAVEDAIVSDVHMGQGTVIDSRGDARGFPYSIAPGDGAMAFWPLFLPPTKMKEYQLLSRAWTAKELAEMNVFNYAVADYEALDVKVDEIIDQLLERPQHALTRTKKIANKLIVQQWNLTQDLAMAYEILDMQQHAFDGHMEPGWSAYNCNGTGRPADGWSPDTAVKAGDEVPA
jgi:enoyl-CoA hydratase